MGGCCSSTEVEPSIEFRKRKDLNADEFDGPIKGRSCTDIQYLLLFVLFIAVWIGLVSYSIAHGDLRRIFVGYDDCGNICGLKNPVNYDPKLGFNCTGADLTSKKLMLIYPESEWKITKRECVRSCADKPNYRQYFQRCIPESQNLAYEFFAHTDVQGFFQKAAEDIHLCKATIIYMCIFALSVSVFMIILFRYFAGVLVWFVLVCVVIISVAASAYLWITWKNSKDTNNITETKTSTYFWYAVVTTITTVILLLLIFSVRKSIHLVAHLFYEAGKAVQAMPLIMLQPFVTFFALILLMFLWVYFFLWIESSGFGMIKPGTHRITYRKDDVIQFTRGYNLVAVFWMIQFLIGCQHMIISGAVATWFFTRKKQQLSSPIAKSYGYLLTYHLGTVALGSLLIAIVQIIRIIFKLMEKAVKNPKNDVTKALYTACSCCLYCLEKILVFLTRNAYIEVAIFGDNLWTSGKRAYHVLANNSIRVIAINSVGDFVLFLGKALVTASSVFLALKLLQGNEGIHYLAVPLGIIGVFAYLVSHAFMTAFEMIIDTIFICFCEDCDMNDGEQQPYFMSKGLMEFVEKSNKVLRVGDAAASPRMQQHGRFFSED